MKYDSPCILFYSDVLRAWCAPGRIVYLSFNVARLTILVILLLFVVSHLAHAKPPIRFGLTKAVFVNESVAYEQWRHYLEKRLGRPVKFVQKRSYHEIQQLLRLGELDFAWICGDPYVRGLKENILKYVATPIINNKPSYRIFLIVPATSSAKTLEDLKGRIFAFSDPDSVSFHALAGGYLSSKREVIRELDSFFKVHFFTYSHVNTVMAVADKMADGGSVDGHVWEELAKQVPELTKKTKIIARSEHYGLPPIVASWRVEDSLAERMKSVLLDMDGNRTGLEILEHLQSNRFSDMDDTLYNSIRNGPAQVPLVSGSFHPRNPRSP